MRLFRRFVEKKDANEFAQSMKAQDRLVSVDAIDIKVDEEDLKSASVYEVVYLMSPEDRSSI